MASLSWAAGCFATNPPDGAFLCGPAPHQCPAGYSCSLAGTCRRGAGQVTIVAGAPGGAGFADGKGSAARFDLPIGIVSDGSGGAFVVDSQNAVIRHVMADGTVVPLAGTPENGWQDQDGPAASAMFNTVQGLAYDTKAQKLYVSDNNPGSIRIVDLNANNQVTTLTLSRQLAHPAELALDGTGNLYVAESSTHIISQIVLATGMVTDYAGKSGVPGFKDETSAMPAWARFNIPTGLCFDSLHGNLFVAEVGNNAVRVINILAGSVATVASASLRGPQSLACDSMRRTLYICDTYNGVIRKANMDTFELATLSMPMLNNAEGVAFDAQNNALLIADTFDDVIRRYDVASMQSAVLAGAPRQNSFADGAAVTVGRLNTPVGLASDGKGTIFFADQDNSLVRQLTSGVLSTVAGTANMNDEVDGASAPEAHFNGPAGLAYDGSGSLYVADGSGHTIRKVTVSTGATTTIAGSGSDGIADGVGDAAGFRQPIGLALDAPNQILYITDPAASTLRRLDLKTKMVTTVAGIANGNGNRDGKGTAASLSNPRGIVYDGMNMLYIADSFNNAIRQVAIDQGYVVSTIAGSTGAITGSNDGLGTSARFHYPQGVALDGHGNLYVTDMQNGLLRVVQLANKFQVVTVAGMAPLNFVKPGPIAGALLNVPTGIVLPGDGTIVVSSPAEDVLLQID